VIARPVNAVFLSVIELRIRWLAVLQGNDGYRIGFNCEIDELVADGA